MVEKKILLPDAFILRMQSQCNDAGLLFQSLNETPPVSFRINPAKSKPNASLKNVSWCNQGFYLDQRPSFTLDPLFHAGSYFVQEASSMFLEQFIHQTGLHQKPVTALDLCASPGGKSTHLISLLHKESLLVSNETIRSRIPALKENLIKWGFPNVIITHNDPNAFASLNGMFDVIVCDAPCSGEGMFRKDPASIKHWSSDHVRHCAERQKRVVQQAWKALKPGGIFIYSTCTFNKEENENVLELLLQTGETDDNIRLQTEGMGNIECSGNALTVYRFYPHRIKGEGFTIAALKKAVRTEHHVKTYMKKFKPVFRNSKHVPAWFEIESGKFYEYKGKLFFLNSPAVRFIEEAANTLNFVYFGTETAEIINRELIPVHESCMSICYRRNAFPEIELSLNDALKYLSGATRFSVDASDGWLLFTYKEMPIGFARKTGNRFNNHYPKGWRIRKQMEQG